MTGRQRFPAGARPHAGRCEAPLHDRGPAGQVVAVRFGFADLGPASAPMTVCADCLADFAVVDLLGLCPFALAGDGLWHQVRGDLPAQAGGLT